jgi:hypothetical protein
LNLRPPRPEQQRLRRLLRSAVTCRPTERQAVDPARHHAVPQSMATAGHVAQLPPDSQRDECRSPTPWCFPLAPEGSAGPVRSPCNPAGICAGRRPITTFRFSAAPMTAIRSPINYVKSTSTTSGPSTCEPFEARLRPKNRSEIRVFSMCALPPSRSESFGVRGRSQLGRTRLVAIARMKAIR